MNIDTSQKKYHHQKKIQAMKLNKNFIFFYEYFMGCIDFIMFFIYKPFYMLSHLCSSMQSLSACQFHHVCFIGLQLSTFKVTKINPAVQRGQF